MVIERNLSNALESLLKEHTPGRVTTIIEKVESPRDYIFLLKEYMEREYFESVFLKEYYWLNDPEPEFQHQQLGVILFYRIGRRFLEINLSGDCHVCKDCPREWLLSTSYFEVWAEFLYKKAFKKRIQGLADILDENKKELLKILIEV